MTPIYRRGGPYFGFLYAGYLFDASAEYLGWVDDSGKLWRGDDGSFLGVLVEDNYILHHTTMSQPSRRSLRSRPSRPTPRSRWTDRAARSMPSGHCDALDGFPDA